MIKTQCRRPSLRAVVRPASQRVDQSQSCNPRWSGPQACSLCEAFADQCETQLASRTMALGSYEHLGKKVRVCMLVPL